jgi:hypothetical protein
LGLKNEWLLLAVSVEYVPVGIEEEERKYKRNCPISLSHYLKIKMRNKVRGCDLLLFATPGAYNQTLYCYKRSSYNY